MTTRRANLTAMQALYDRLQRHSKLLTENEYYAVCAAADGDTQDEIGVALGVSRTRIQQLIAQARHKLKDVS